MVEAFTDRDFERCERLQADLKASKFEMNPIEYKGVYGDHIYTSHEKTEREKQFKSSKYAENRDKFGSCLIQGHNEKLRQALAGAEKLNAYAATAFAVHLERNKVLNTDIPMTMASCNNGSFRSAYLSRLGNIPDTCKVFSIHTHNTGDRNPAVHLHVQCSEVSDTTIGWLRQLVKETNDVSWRMCSGGEPTRKSTQKDYEKITKCQENCMKKARVQRRLDIMGGI